MPISPAIAKPLIFSHKEKEFCHMLSAAEWFLFTVVTVYVVWIPFTRMDERPLLHAVHDMLYHGNQLELYDHVLVQDSVPWPMLSSVLLALLVKPIQVVVQGLGGGKFAIQIVGTRLCMYT
jgi:alpha-1,6-mannosyltransferase